MIDLFIIDFKNGTRHKI